MDGASESRPASVLDGWLDRVELAKELGVSPKTLKRWDAERSGPPSTQLGKRKLYNRADVRVWLEARVKGRSGGR